MIRIIVAFLPLASTPALLYLIANGLLNFGGGEKDLLLLLPWLLVSLVFAVASLTLWYRGWPAPRATAWSAIISLTALLCVAAALASLGQLGTSGSG